MGRLVCRYAEVRSSRRLMGDNAQAESNFGGANVLSM
jgi:hypothetical protein